MTSSKFYCCSKRWHVLWPTSYFCCSGNCCSRTSWLSVSSVNKLMARSKPAVTARVLLNSSKMGCESGPAVCAIIVQWIWGQSSKRLNLFSKLLKALCLDTALWPIACQAIYLIIGTNKQPQAPNTSSDCCIVVNCYIDADCHIVDEIKKR